MLGVEFAGRRFGIRDWPSSWSATPFCTPRAGLRQGLFRFKICDH
jgi:hypothetical protein